MKSVLRGSAIAAAIAVASLSVAALVAQRVSDGPMGPLAGGVLRAGALASERDVDGSFFEGGEIELQLVEPPRSRITGAFVHEGQLYVPCDLGFLWRRVPQDRFRWILAGIYSVKRWHEDALRDGRSALRSSGKRYERQAVRVTDPELLAALRSRIEAEANEFFAPEGLRKARGDPEATWFFRLDPRPF